VVVIELHLTAHTSMWAGGDNVTVSTWAGGDNVTVSMWAGGYNVTVLMHLLCTFSSSSLSLTRQNSEWPKAPWPKWSMGVAEVVSGFEGCAQMQASSFLAWNSKIA